MRTSGILLLITALACGAPALAEDGDYGERSGYNRDGYDRQERMNKRDHNYRAPRPIELHLQVEGDGRGTIRLKQLLRRQHRLDTDEWRIRSVNVYSRGKRNACADLRVGHHRTGPVYLRRGVTTIAAPHGDPDGHWKLEVANTRVREVSVILEPKRGHSRHSGYTRERDTGPRLRNARVALNWALRF